MPQEDQDPFETDPRVIARVQELMARLRVSDVLDSLFLCEQLSQIGKPAVAALCAVVADRSAPYRFFAAGALGEIGEDAGEAAPVLIKTIADAPAELKGECLKALGQIRGRDEASLKALHSSLSDPDGSVRVYAAAAILSSFPHDAQALPLLVAGLRDSTCNDICRTFIANTLGTLPNSAMVRQALLRALDDPHPNVRKAAVAAIGKFGPDAKDCIPALIALLDTPDLFLRIDCMDALRRIGWPAWPALLALSATLPQKRVSEVLGACASGTINVSLHGASALQSIIPDNEAARKALRAAALSPDGQAHDRIMAAECLAQTGTEPDAMRVLTAFAASADVRVRRAAGHALARLGRVEGIPPLVESLKFDNLAVRLAAARALGELGAAAKNAVPGLQEAARNPFDAPLRREASKALKRILGN